MENFADILNREFRWPKPGDRAFTVSEEWQRNAQVQKGAHARLVIMMTGYKMAADQLVEQSHRSGYDRDTLVYPLNALIESNANGSQPGRSHSGVSFVIVSTMVTSRQQLENLSADVRRSRSSIGLRASPPPLWHTILSRHPPMRFLAEYAKTQEILSRAWVLEKQN